MILCAYEFGSSAVENDHHLRCFRFFVFFRGNHIYLKLPFPFVDRLGEIRLVHKKIMQPEWRAKMSDVRHSDSSHGAGYWRKTKSHTSTSALPSLSLSVLSMGPYARAVNHGNTSGFVTQLH